MQLLQFTYVMSSEIYQLWVCFLQIWGQFFLFVDCGIFLVCLVNVSFSFLWRVCDPAELKEDGKQFELRSEK